MSVHSRLAPSSASRWTNCPASAREVAPEKPPTAATEKGNRQHKRVAELLQNDEPFRHREAEDVRVYVNHVLDAQADHPEALMLVETTLQSLTVPDLFGTPDVVRIGDNYIHVPDLKTGKWSVPAKNNPQLMTYLYLAIDNFGERPYYFGDIIQYGKVDPAVFTPAQMREFGKTVAWAAANPNIYVAGEHCIWCPWRGTCEHGKAYEIENQKSWPPA